MPRRRQEIRFTVRYAVPGDAEVFARIQYASVAKAWRSVVPGDFDAFLSERFDHNQQTAKYKERAGDPDRVLCVVEADGEPVGFGGARKQTPEDVPQGFEYQGNAFYFLPEYVGSGASQVLVAGLHKALTDRGVKSVAGWCFADNKIARNFYEKQGAQLITDAVAPKEYDIAPHVAYGWTLS